MCKNLEGKAVPGQKIWKRVTDVSSMSHYLAGLPIFLRRLQSAGCHNFGPLLWKILTLHAWSVILCYWIVSLGTWCKLLLAVEFFIFWHLFKGDVVRSLKASKADKSDIDVEVAKLLDLKKKLGIAMGINPSDLPGKGKKIKPTKK